jgi:hypothetical protein
MKRLLVASIIVSALVALPIALSAIDITSQQWRAFNVKPDTASYWDINHVTKDASGWLVVPVQQFDTKSTGSFLVYLLNNYNVNLTGKTLSTSVFWTPGIYETRSEGCGGAHVRFEFQDVSSGPYDSNDYWWSTVSLDLNAVSSGEITASLADRTLWTNQAGKSATDTTPDWEDWTGTIVAMSPYDGFTKAMKKVKQLSLSFGSDCRYASGVALMDGTGTFTVQSFVVQ